MSDKQPLGSTWYRVSRWGDRINLVTVQKSTSSSVWIDGRRRAMATVFEKYFRSHDEAIAFLRQRKERDLKEAEEGITRLTLTAERLRKELDAESVSGINRLDRTE